MNSLNSMIIKTVAMTSFPSIGLRLLVLGHRVCSQPRLVELLKMYALGLQQNESDPLEQFKVFIWQVSDPKS